jgi:tRNA nucleotidyltransferase/poly(A) polymerase
MDGVCMKDSNKLEQKYRRQRQEVKPYRIYDEMAELGLLEEFLEWLNRKKKNYDQEFHEEMLEILYDKSESSVPEIEFINLEQLQIALADFLKRTEKWKTRRH